MSHPPKDAESSERGASSEGAARSPAPAGAEDASGGQPGASHAEFPKPESEGLCGSIPALGALPFVPPRAIGRRVVRLVSLDSDLSIELQPGLNRIGRQRLENHIVLVGSSISRYHAEIEVSEDGVLLRDMGSANGTLVNEERVTERVLRAGDLIRFSEQFKFRLLVDIAVETPDSTTFSSSDEPLSSTEEGTPAGARSRDDELISLRQRAQGPAAAEEQRAEVPTAVVHAAGGAADGLARPVRDKAGQQATERLRAYDPPEPLAEAELGDSMRGAAGRDELAVIERERRQLGVLFQVSKRCMSAESLAELDRLLINVLERIVAFDRGFLAYQLPTGDWKLVMSPRGDRWDRKFVRKLLQTALKSRTPLVVPDSRSDDSLGAPVPGRMDTRLLLPLRARGAAVGAIFFVSAHADSFDEHTVDFLALFADIAALAVVNCARLQP